LFTACLSSGYASVLTDASVLELFGYCSTRRAVDKENWRVWTKLARSVREDVDARLRNMVVCIEFVILNWCFVVGSGCW
jgi:hypothetical protein